MKNRDLFKRTGIRITAAVISSMLFVAAPTGSVFAAESTTGETAQAAKAEEHKKAAPTKGKTAAAAAAAAESPVKAATEAPAEEEPKKSLRKSLRKSLKKNRKRNLPKGTLTVARTRVKNQSLEAELKSPQKKNPGLGIPAVKKLRKVEIPAKKETREGKVPRKKKSPRIWIPKIQAPLQTARRRAAQPPQKKHPTKAKLLTKQELRKHLLLQPRKNKRVIAQQQLPRLKPKPRRKKEKI